MPVFFFVCKTRLVDRYCIATGLLTNRMIYLFIYFISILSYLTDRSKHILVALQAVWMVIFGDVVLSTEFLVTSEAAEVVQVPVLLLYTCILTTEYDLHEKSYHIF